jgi:hypothetical protein
MYIALIDTCCGAEFMEGVKSALLAALEAMPSFALFGFVTFGEEVRVWDVCAFFCVGVCGCGGGCGGGLFGRTQETVMCASVHGG